MTIGFGGSTATFDVVDTTQELSDVNLVLAGMTATTGTDPFTTSTFSGKGIDIDTNQTQRLESYATISPGSNGQDTTAYPDVPFSEGTGGGTPVVTQINQNVPTSGPISTADFYGATNGES